MWPRAGIYRWITCFSLLTLASCAYTSVGGTRYSDLDGNSSMTTECEGACVDRAENGECIRFSEEMARVCAKYLRAARLR